MNSEQCLYVAAACENAAKFNSSEPKSDALTRRRYSVMLAFVLALCFGVARVQAQGGSALQFDGTDDIVSTSLIVTNPQSFTISVWFKTSTVRGGRLIGFGNSQSGTSSSYDRALYLSDDGRVFFGVHSGVTVQSLNSAASFKDGTWHHAAATFSTTDGMKLYVDAQLAAANAAFNGVVAYNGFWRIGGDSLTGWPSQPTSFYFAGQMDEAQIWNRVRTQSEIQADFHRLLAGNESGLSVLYHFNEGSGATASDVAATEGTNTANLINGTAWVPSTAPIGIPVVALNGVTNITLQTAVVSALVNPNFQSTTSYVQYGTTTNYGFQSAGAYAGSGGTSAPVNVPVSGLQPATRYFYRLSAQSAGGTNYSANDSFLTLTTAPPIVATLPYSAPTYAGATLNASVNPNNAPTDVYFEYGATTNYGTATLATNLPGGITDAAVALPISGLPVGAIRNYRVMAKNASGPSYGANALFASLTFSNVSLGPPDLTTAASAWGDFDNDGRLDLAIAGNPTQHGDQRVTQIWRNLGNGSFSNINAGLPGVSSYHTIPTVAWGDYDNDGWLDLLISGPTTFYGEGRITQIWRNLGNGTFTNSGISLPGVILGQAAWADFDSDGRLDVIITGNDDDLNYDNPKTQVWRNTGSGFGLFGSNLPAFENSAVAVADFDNDGFPDVAISGRDRQYERRCQVWRSNGNGMFGLAADLTGVINGSLAWLDADNDGFLDLLATGRDAQGNLWCRVFRNNGGSGTFTPYAGLSGFWEGDAQVGDYDNDGHMDIALQGVVDSGSGILAEIWRNTGTHFTNIVTALPGRNSRVAWGDYNNDGRLDLALGSATYSHVLTTSNTPPLPPTSTAFVVSGDSVLLSWAAGSDAQTPAAALSYNIRVGTTPGGGQIVSPQANSTNGFRNLPQMGNANLRLNARVLKLTQGRTYFWSVQSVDSAFAGSAFSGEKTFFVPFVPAATTLVATAVSPTNATLNGAVNPNQNSTTFYFRWGTTPNLGNVTPTLPAGSGSNAVLVSAIVTGLVNSTTYYYQLVASNAAGTSSSTTLNFTTLSEAPSVLTHGPAVVSSTSALLSGSVAPNGLPTTAFFQYGTTTNYSSTTPTRLLGVGALQFNGSQSAQAGPINLTNTPFTVEFWMRRTRAGRWDLALFQGEGSNNRGLHIGFRPNDAFTFAFWGNDMDTPSSYGDTDWHHWACTYEGGTGFRRIYRDGALLVQATANAQYQGAGNIVLGFAPPLAAYLAGSLDEVRIWNTARTQAQIAASMNASAQGNEAGLLALWRFDETGGTVAADGTGHGFDASLSGAPTWGPGSTQGQGSLPFSILATALLTNLVPNQTYYYRVVGSNSLGVTFGRSSFFRPVDKSPVNAPVAFTGFNADAVIENGGIAVPVHDNYGWFAVGTSGHTDGLPMGTNFTSGATNCGQNTVFRLAPAAATNALKLGDGFPTNGTLTLKVPAAYTSFSILGASGNGGGLPNLTLHFDDSSQYAVTWNALDWCASCGERRELGLIALDSLGRNSGLFGAPGGSNYASGFTYESNAAFGLYETKIDLAAVGLASNRIQYVTFKKASAVSSFIFAMSAKITLLPLAFVQIPAATNSVCIGSVASYAVTVDNPALATYQWQRRAPGTTNFVNLPGATNAAYTTPTVALTDDGAAYRIIVSGPLNTITSAPAGLDVLPITPTSPQFNFNFAAMPTNGAVYGSAFFDTTNGALVLTSAITNQSGAFIIDDPAPGRIVRSFTASFKTRVTGGTQIPADGFSFNWATNVPNGTWANPEDGVGNGLSVCFDIYDNGGNEAPAIDVKWGGAVIAHQPVLSNFLVTGTNFANVFIRLLPDATLDVFFDCQPVYERFPLPGVVATGLRGARFALGARTSGNTATQVVDDFALEFSSVLPMTLAIIQQPPNAGACSGATASFNVTVNDPSQVFGYQWQRLAPGDSSFSNLPDATNTAYTTPALTLPNDSTRYRVLIFGYGVTLTSAEAEVRMPAVTTPAISYDFSSPPANTAIFGSAFYDNSSLVLDNGISTGAFIVNDPAPGSLTRGFTAAFQVAVDSWADGGYGFSFNWATNLPNGTMNENGTGNGLTISFRTLGGGFFGYVNVIVIWNGTGMGSTYIPFSDVARGYGAFNQVVVRLSADQKLDLFFGCQPLFVGLPVPATPVFGGRFGFGARSDVNLYEYCQLDNLAIQLDTVTNPPLTITRQPKNVGACPGGASFSVTVDYPILVTSYQWQRREPGASAFVAIPGATAAQYATPPLTLADVSAAYRVLVAGPSNTTTSDVAQIVFVVPSPGAPTVSLDFNSGLPANAALFGSAYLDSGALELNGSRGSAIGSLIINDPLPGQVVSNFTARFKLRLKQQTTPPADGFSFNWATDLPNAAFGEDGAGTGLTISFDTYDNGGGEAPAVDIYWNGTIVAHRPVALEQLMTGDNFTEVFIRLNADGTLDVIYGCQSFYVRQPLPEITGLLGARFAIGGRTGGFVEWHTIDDLTLELNAPAITPPQIRRIIQLSDGNIQLSFNSTPAAPFTVLACTNIALPLTNWTVLGPVTEIAPGSYQFTDLDTTNSALKFYQVRSP